MKDRRTLSHPPRRRTLRACQLAGASLGATTLYVLACGGGERGWFSLSRWDPWEFWEPQVETDVTSTKDAGIQTNSTVRYQQVSIIDRHTGHGAPSHVTHDGTGWATYDNFRLETTEYLTAIRWQGYFYDSTDPDMNPAPQNTDHWEVRICLDDYGNPGEEIFRGIYASTFGWETSPGTVLSNYVGETPAGPENSPASYYNYEVEFETPFFAKAGKTYWISVTSVSSPTTSEFTWAPGCSCELPPLSLAANSRADGSMMRNEATGETIYQPGDRAFSLVGSPFSDLDNDGMSDAWEQSHGLNASLDDAFEDLDLDGATNLREFALGSDPQNPDTDGDGLLDGVESGRGMYYGAYDTGTSPIKRDTDGDGLLDSHETGWTMITTRTRTGSNPNLPDSDNDGYADDLELHTGFHPGDWASRPDLKVLDSGLLGGRDLSDISNGVHYSWSDLPISGYHKSIDAKATPWHPLNVFNNKVGTEQDWTIAEDCRFPISIDTHYEEPVELSHFTITSGADRPELDPTVWEIQGSNDGRNFTTIYQRNSKYERLWTGRSQTLRFEAGLHYTKPAAYTTIRFVCYETSSIGSAAAFQLGELEYFSMQKAITSFSVAATMPPSGSGLLMEINWTALQGVPCIIERSSDLKTWTALPGTHVGTGAPQCHFDDTLPTPTPPRMFYRVRVNE